MNIPDAYTQRLFREHTNILMQFALIIKFLYLTITSCVPACQAGVFSEVQGVEWESLNLNLNAVTCCLHG